MNNEWKKALRDFPRVWQRVTESRNERAKAPSPRGDLLMPRRQKQQKRCRQRFCP